MKSTCFFAGGKLEFISVGITVRTRDLSLFLMMTVLSFVFCHRSYVQSINHMIKRQSTKGITAHRTYNNYQRDKDYFDVEIFCGPVLITSLVSHTVLTLWYQRLINSLFFFFFFQYKDLRIPVSGSAFIIIMSNPSSFLGLFADKRAILGITLRLAFYTRLRI